MKPTRKNAGMNVDIIIVTHNACKKLRKCIASVRKYTPRDTYRLTIVDNNSSDGTSEFLKILGARVNIITNKENMGLSAGTNVAINSTRNEYIAVLDDDAEVTKNWLTRLYKKINEHHEIGIVGCKTVFPDAMIFSAGIDVSTGVCENIGCGEPDKGQRDYVKEVDAVCRACWLMRRRVVEKVGLFDEQFFPSQYDDIDYCLRTRLAGFKIIYDGTVRIIHHSLYRTGGMKATNVNLIKFMDKWDHLKKFVRKNSPRNCNGSRILKVRNFLAKGLRCEKEKKFTQAMECFRNALRLEPYNYTACHHLAILYCKTGKIKQARLQAAKVLEIFDSVQSK